MVSLPWLLGDLRYRWRLVKEREREDGGCSRSKASEVEEVDFHGDLTHRKLLVSRFRNREAVS